MGEETYDITIVGAGPVGLYGLYYAGLRGLKAKVIEALPYLGGQLAALYPEKYIYDLAGFPQVRAKDLVAYLEEQALQYDPAVRLNERVTGLLRGQDGVLELTTDRDLHLTRALLVAAGVGAFAPRRLDAPGLAEREGRGVYYFVRDLDGFRHKSVVVVGGGDSAVDWALSLQEVAAKVTLVHRSDQFRAHERAVQAVLASPAVDVRLFNELVAVSGEAGVEGVTLRDNRTGATADVEADALLLNLGFQADLGPVRDWGLEVVRNSIPVSANMETNLPGVYAAGDIVAHPGHLKLIAVGAAEAAVAVNHARHYLDPKATVEPGHSTFRKVPQTAL